MTQVGLDRHNTGTPETVKHTYGVSGFRDQVELPGGDTIDYGHDYEGRITTVEDWDPAAKSSFYYDGVGRLIKAHHNMLIGTQDYLDTYFGYDPAGRLLSKKTIKADPDPLDTLASFEYQVDARGNRTQVVEAIQIADGAYTIPHDDDSIDYDQYWTHQAGYVEAEGDDQAGIYPELNVTVLGETISVVFKTGPDHGRCRIWLNGQFDQNFNGYSSVPGEETVALTVPDGGPHVLRMQATGTKQTASNGYWVRIKEIQVSDEFDVQTVQYEYDALSRLVGAHHYHGENLTSGLFRQYEHKFDEAGNRFREKIFFDGATAPDVHFRYVYDDANQLEEVKDNILSSSVYPTYDDAGRMTSDGTNAFSWDAAGRMLTARGTSYTYNGLGQRIGLNDGSIAYEFILDTQPGLYKVLRKTWNDGVAKEQSYVHGPTGILRRQLNNGSWRMYVTDGLGSVRQELDSSLNPANYHHYEPFGEIFAQSAPDMVYNFTGEPLDSNGLLHLRARYLLPELGVFPSLDPLEGGLRSMGALNRYAYVAGNPINFVDPSGMAVERRMVRLGYASYSCHCGWIDWTHVFRGGPAFYLMQAIEIAKNRASWHESILHSNNQGVPSSLLDERLRSWIWGFSITKASSIPIIGPTTIFNNEALIQHQVLKDTSMQGFRAKVVGILMDANEVFEFLQSPDRVFPGSSSFSEEDLPSNAIGLYLGLQRYNDPDSVPEGNVNFLNDNMIDPLLEAAWTSVRRLCDVFSKSESLDVYDDLYDGGSLFEAGRKSWEGKLRPTGYTPTSCDPIQKKCPEPPRWPTEFSNITNMRSNVDWDWAFDKYLGFPAGWGSTERIPLDESTFQQAGIRQIFFYGDRGRINLHPPEPVPEPPA